MISKYRRLCVALALVAAAVASITLSTTPANAETSPIRSVSHTQGTDGAGMAITATARNGVCEVGEFCLYWGSGRTGSVSDFNGSIPNYGASQPTCYEFRGPGTGQFQCVKNNAASAWNRTTAYTVTVYFNSGYGGVSDTFAPGVTRNLTDTFLENASHRFVQN